MSGDQSFMKGVGVYIASSGEDNKALLDELRDAGASTMNFPSAPLATHILVTSSNNRWIQVSEAKPQRPSSYKDRWTLNETLWHYGHVETGGRPSGNMRAKCVVRKQWAIDCIAAGKILPVTGYALRGTTDAARVTAKENTLPPTDSTPLTPPQAPVRSPHPVVTPPEPPLPTEETRKSSLQTVNKGPSSGDTTLAPRPPAPPHTALFTMGSLPVRPKTPHRVPSYDPRIRPSTASTADTTPITKPPTPDHGQAPLPPRPATPPLPAGFAEEWSTCLPPVDSGSGLENASACSSTSIAPASAAQGVLEILAPAEHVGASSTPKPAPEPTTKAETTPTACATPIDPKAIARAWDPRLHAVRPKTPPLTTSAAVATINSAVMEEGRSTSPNSSPRRHAQTGTSVVPVRSKKRKIDSTVTVERPPSKDTPIRIPSPPLQAPPTPQLTDEARHDSPPTMMLDSSEMARSQPHLSAGPLASEETRNDKSLTPIFHNAYGLAYSFHVACPESPALGLKMEVLIQHFGKGELVAVEEAIYIVVDHPPGRVPVRMNVEEVVLAHTRNRPSKVVVSHTWIDDCTSQGAFLDHRPFVVEFVDSGEMNFDPQEPLLDIPQLGAAANPIFLVDDDDDDDDLNELQADVHETRAGEVEEGPSRSRKRSRSRSTSPPGSLIVIAPDDVGGTDGADYLGQGGLSHEDDDLSDSESESEWGGGDDNAMGYSKRPKAPRTSNASRKKVAPEDQKHYDFLRDELSLRGVVVLGIFIHSTKATKRFRPPPASESPAPVSTTTHPFVHPSRLNLVPHSPQATHSSLQQPSHDTAPPSPRTAKAYQFLQSRSDPPVGTASRAPSVASQNATSTSSNTNVDDWLSRSHDAAFGQPADDGGPDHKRPRLSTIEQNAAASEHGSVDYSGKSRVQSGHYLDQQRQQSLSAEIAQSVGSTTEYAALQEQLSTLFKQE